MRTRKGAARNRAKNRLFKRAKGYRGGRGSLLRTVKETLIRAGVYAYRDRKVRKRDFRRLWITRINAASRLRGMRYSLLIVSTVLLPMAAWCYFRAGKYIDQDLQRADEKD